MKTKDIGLIAVIGIISAVLSILLSGILFSSEEDRSQSVEVVEPIVADFLRPSKDYFNENSINPTKTITIGDDINKKPFGDSE